MERQRHNCRGYYFINLFLFRYLHFMFGFFLEHSFGANGNLLTLFQYEKMGSQNCRPAGQFRQRFLKPF